MSLYAVNRDVNKRQHPEALRPFIKEIQNFAHHCHFNVLHPILRYDAQHTEKPVITSFLRLLALGLELPEDTLVKQHNFDASGESSGVCPSWFLQDFRFVLFTYHAVRFMK